jgi:hypothetical protein
MGAIAGITGSVIGAKITGGGSGYKFPPFIEISDNCNQGYGAIGRAIINDSGEVTSVYIVSEGENYPVEFIENYIVDSILIENPGQNYESTDIATDQFGNSYSIEVFEGSVIKAQPINTTRTTETVGTVETSADIIQVNDLPIITIESNTGSGAILKPILNTVPTEFQGEVKQVIDCVT